MLDCHGMTALTYDKVEFNVDSQVHCFDIFSNRKLEK